MDNLKGKAVSSVRWTGASAIATTTIRLVVLAILARLLGPEAFGLAAMVFALTGFTQIFVHMGLADATIQKQETTALQLSSVYWLNLAFGFTVFIVLWAAAPLIVNIYDEPRLSGLIVWVALGLLIATFGQQFGALLRRDLRFREVSSAQIAAAVVDGTVAITTALAGEGVHALIWGSLAGTTTRTFILVKIGSRIWRPRFRFVYEDVKGHLRFGLFHVGGVAVNEVNVRLAQVVIGVILGARALGFYNLAFRLVMDPATRINPIINNVTFPIYARIQGDTARLKRWFFATVRLLSLTNAPIVLGIAAIAPVLVPVVFGDQWRPAVLLVQILAVIGLLRSTGNPIGSLLMAKGRTDLSFKWNLALAFTQAPGILIGAHLGGVVGVATAMGILQVAYATFGTYLALIRPLLGPCLSDYVMARLPTFAAAGAMALVVAAVGFLLGNTESLGVLVILTAVGALAYAVLAGLFLRGTLVQFRDLIRLRQSKVAPETSESVPKLSEPST